MFKKLIVVVLFSVATQTTFSDTVTGKISRLYPSSGTGGDPDLVYFSISGNSCKSNTYWYFKLQGEASKAWFSMLVAATATKSSVNVSFNGACNPAADQEIKYIFQDFSY